MLANGETNRPGVWPTVWGFVRDLALVVSSPQSGGGDPRRPTARGSWRRSSATSAGPGIPMGMTPADSFKGRDPNAPPDTGPGGDGAQGHL